LNRLPKGFPKPDLRDNVIHNTENSNPNIPYLWRNMNIFYKKPTAVGFTPYSLKTTTNAEKSGNYLPVLNNPVVFLANRLSNANIIDSTSFDTLSLKKIEVVSFSPNRMELKVKTDQRQLLTYLQNIYPGWQVSINGKAEKIITTNFTFMSIWLDAGESDVKFEYRPSNIIICYYVSLIAFILMVSTTIVLAAGNFLRNRRYSN
jgi:hypothetical protein